MSGVQHGLPCNKYGVFILFVRLFVFLLIESAQGIQFVSFVDFRCHPCCRLLQEMVGVLPLVTW